jgi:DNA-binding MarR family transcriptional regulator
MSSLRNPRQHDDLLNYQLKRLVTIGGAPAIRLCEGRYGVTRSEWRVIAAFVEDGPMSPSVLAQRTHIEQARASKIITDVIAKGMLQRAAQPGDRRRATVSATPAGKRLYAELFPRLAEINRRIMTALDEREAVALERYLQKLTDRALEIHGAGGGVDVLANRRRGGSRRMWT